jgi:hypothetical protein
VKEDDKGFHRLRRPFSKITQVLIKVSHSSSGIPKKRTPKRLQSKEN